MPEENNQNPNPVQPPAVEPVGPAPVEFPAPAPAESPVADKPKKSILPVVLILVIVFAGIAAGIYFYLSGVGGTQTPVTEVQTPIPTAVPESPEPGAVSDSLDPDVIDKEIEQTDLDPVEPELEQLDTYTNQL